MKITIILLVSAFSAYLSWGVTCSNTGCVSVDAGKGCSAAASCKVSNGVNCWEVWNSTGNTIHIPGNPADLTSFWASVPGGGLYKNPTACPP